LGGAYSQISFDLILDNSEETCYNPTEDFDEGIELSVHLSSPPAEWIPVSFLYYIHNNGPHPGVSLVDIGDRNDNFKIRGYEVRLLELETGKGLQMMRICNLNTSESIQFRWLQTSVLNPSGMRDAWMLDNITVYHELYNGERITLLNENFDKADLE